MSAWIILLFFLFGGSNCGCHEKREVRRGNDCGCGRDRDRDCDRNRDRDCDCGCNDNDGPGFEPRFFNGRETCGCEEKDN